MTGIVPIPYGEGWFSQNGTESSSTGATCLKAVVFGTALMIGTGGTMDAGYFVRRHDMGYKFTQVESAPVAQAAPHRTPADNVTYVRENLKPAVSEFASLFKVSRQTVYDWQNGAQPAPEHEKKLEDLARAVDVFMMEGVSISPFLLKRRIAEGKTFFDIIRQGGSAEQAARQLSEMYQKELRQRRVLDARLAGRKPSTKDFTDVIPPAFEEG